MPILATFLFSSNVNYSNEKIGNLNLILHLNFAVPSLHELGRELSSGKLQNTASTEKSQQIFGQVQPEF